MRTYDRPWQRNGPRKRPVAERFWEKVDKAGRCWIWLGARNSKGYPVIQVDGKAVYATHVSLELDGRPLQRDEFACHRCDNPPCVNPDHLYAGTHKANMADMVLKGRSSRSPRSAESRAKASASIKAYFAAHPEALVQLRKTHCPRGHEYPPGARGQSRLCRECRHLLAATRRWKDRGPAPERVDGVLTHCYAGHMWTPENTRVWRGNRVCRACHAARARERRRQKREAA